MKGPSVLVATSNRGKLVEFREILCDLAVEWRSVSDLGPVDFPEEGDDYAANALAKACAASAQTGVVAVADDSGLEVDALGGEPGPLSARYGGPSLDDRGRVAKLLSALEDVAEEARGARFVCHAAWAAPDGETFGVRGICEGRILRSPTGVGGFGYDPIFVPQGYEVSMAELGDAEKNRISHRGRALRELSGSLAAYLAKT